MPAAEQPWDFVRAWTVIQLGAAFRRPLGVHVNRIDVVPPQSHFRTDGQVCGHRRTHGGDDLANAVGILQERGAAVMAVDRSRGTAEIEVHRASAGLNGDQGSLGEQVRVAAQELHLNRKPRGSCFHESIRERAFGRRRRPGTAWLMRRNLRHAESEPAEFRQQGSHRPIGYSLHGRKLRGLERRPGSTGFV